MVEAGNNPGRAVHVCVLNEPVTDTHVQSSESATWVRCISDVVFAGSSPRRILEFHDVNRPAIACPVFQSLQNRIPWTSQKNPAPRNLGIHPSIVKYAQDFFVCQLRAVGVD